jgi:hypothetical protein
MPVSDCDDVDVLRVCREGFEILDVCRDYGSFGFGRSDHERVDRGTASGEPTQKRGTTDKGLGDHRRDVASLGEFVLDGVATRVALQTLDENDGGDAGWPQPRLAQGDDHPTITDGTMPE